MPLETVTYISDLVPANPDGADSRTTSDDHLRNIKKGVKNALSGFAGGVIVTGTDGGAVNAYTVANSLPSLTDRVSVVFSPTVTNTAAATININSLGAKSIKRVDGADLTAGELVAGSVYVAVYNGTEFRLLAPTLAYIMALSLGTAYPTSPADSGKFLQSTGTGFQWAVSGIGAVATTSGSANITLTSTSSGYQAVSMTAMGKHVTLPDATTMTVGGPRFIIKNDGGYPFGIRDSAGTLVMAVAAGGVAYLTLKDNTTAAGSWSVIGDNLEPGLITIDNTFSSTYSSTVLAPFVALDSNTSFHFAALSSGFAAFVVDNAGKVLTTPVTVSATSGDAPRAAFKVSATSAIVFFGSGNPTSKAVVLTLSGVTPSFSLSVGGATTATDTYTVYQEDSVGAPKVVQLSSTLYLASYVQGTSNSVAAISVSGNSATFGSPVVLSASGVSSGTVAYALSASAALVIYQVGTVYNAAVVSISGTTCTAGTPVAGTGTIGNNGAASSCLLSATKAIVITDGGSGTATQAQVITISGTAVSVGGLLSVESGMSAPVQLFYTANSATRYNPHLFPLSASTALLWYLDGSGISRAVVLSESGGTVTAGTIMYRSISGAASGSNDFGGIFPQGTSEFLALKVGTVAGTNIFKSRAVAHKVTGTNITVGSATGLDEMGNGLTPVTQVLARLSSGDYLVGAPTSGNGSFNTSIPVLRSNGDFVVKRGAIAVPTLWGGTWPVPAVSSNRVVILAATDKSGSTVGASTAQLRLLNVEIAA